VEFTAPCMSTMVALRKSQAGPGAELQQIPIPLPGPHDILIRVRAAAICGSDRQVYAWRPSVAQLGLKFPFTMGHEFAGVVEAKGEHVSHIQAGDHVAGETHVPCGHCYQCNTGNAHVCEKMGIVGRSVNGCFAEYVLLPEQSVWKLPGNLPFEQGALLEPLGVGVHSLEVADVSGKIVVLMGVGAIGLLTLQAAKALGALEAIAIGRTPEKLELARSFGADLVINAREENVTERVRQYTMGHMADVVIEFTGDPVAFGQSLEILRIGGRLVAVGNADAPIPVDVLKHVIHREITITGIHGRRMYGTWINAQNLVRTGRINLKEMIAGSFELKDYEKAFALAGKEARKVILLP